MFVKKKIFCNRFTNVVLVCLRVSRKQIIFKAKSLYDEKCGEDNPLQDGFVASRDWLEKFMKRNNPSCRRKYPVELINKLVSCCPRATNVEEKVI